MKKRLQKLLVLGVIVGMVSSQGMVAFAQESEDNTAITLTEEYDLAEAQDETEKPDTDMLQDEQDENVEAPQEEGQVVSDDTEAVLDEATGDDIEAVSNEVTGEEAQEAELDKQSGKWMKDGSGYWYQYEDKSYPAGEIVEIDGKKYGFNDSGYMVTGWKQFVIDGEADWYYFEADGELCTGWKSINGSIYYFCETDFQWQGYMICNDAVQFEDGVYLFNASGACVITPGWQKLKDDDGHTLWFYVKTDGSLQVGWLQLGQTRYCFNEYGVMLQNTLLEEDGEVFYFDADGLLTNPPCWVQDGSTWFYLGEDGMPVTGWQEIGGSRYFFDQEDGRMYAGGVYDIDGQEYKFKEGGALVTGWDQDGDIWYYRTKDGLATGWQQIGSTWYYFGDDGRMYQNTYSYRDGEIYFFNADGSWNQGTGWKSITYNDPDYGMYTEWFYLNADGTPYRGWMKSGSTWYYFLSGGYMATGAMQIDDVTYFFNEDGTLNQKEGWKNITYNELSVEWYYVKADGTLQTGWMKSGSTWYYFVPNGRMVDYPININETAYFFNSDGSLNENTGWKKYTWYAGSSMQHELWYYGKEDGTLQTGWATIGGKQYYFGLMVGEMYCSRSLNEDGKKYVFDANGLVATSSCWYKNFRYSNYWRYLDANGNDLVNAWLQSGGKWYYFDEDGDTIVNDVIEIDGKIYGFDENGVMKTGWFNPYSDYWYYFDENGAGYTGWVQSGSNKYWIENGVWIKD